MTQKTLGVLGIGVGTFKGWGLCEQERFTSVICQPWTRKCQKRNYYQSQGRGSLKQHSRNTVAFFSHPDVRCLIAFLLYRFECSPSFHNKPWFLNFPIKLPHSLLLTPVFLWSSSGSLCSMSRRIRDLWKKGLSLEIIGSWLLYRWGHGSRDEKWLQQGSKNFYFLLFF